MRIARCNQARGRGSSSSSKLLVAYSRTIRMEGVIRGGERWRGTRVTNLEIVLAFKWPEGGLGVAREFSPKKPEISVITGQNAAWLS